MTMMRTPSFTFSHDLSAVQTGARMASPNAKQARSPKDKPSTRVFAIISPANRACSEVKGPASPMGAQRWLPGVVRAEPSIDKFTVHFRQIHRAGGCGAEKLGRQLVSTRLLVENGKQCEASNTTLFIAGRPAMFRDQFVHQRRIALDVLTDQPLRSFQVVFQGADAQFVVLNPQNDLVAHSRPQPLAKGGGDERWETERALKP
jgi:hypothetical protein